LPYPVSQTRHPRGPGHQEAEQIDDAAGVNCGGRDELLLERKAAGVDVPLGDSCESRLSSDLVSSTTVGVSF
jgi:hypothetical protein